jgi:hypothetical protein
VIQSQIKKNDGDDDFRRQSAAKDFVIFMECTFFATLQSRLIQANDQSEVFVGVCDWRMVFALFIGTGDQNSS